jgi:4,5-DOPA dioxygenase extradiol
MDKKMPVLFVGHGSPLNIVLENSYTRSLAAFGKFLPKPRAIMVISAHWGLDHASWAVLKHMYPHADVPVFEMSLHYSFNEWHPKPLQYHYDLARQLAGLRRRGVLIIGSGNIVHNLGMIDFENMDAKPVAWARDFDEQVKANLLAGNHQDLIHYERMGKASSLAVPSLDHYLPMIYAISLQEKEEPLTFIHEGFQNGSISMRCFRIGQ